MFGRALGISVPSLQNDPPDGLQMDALSSKYSMYNSVSQKLMAKMGYREGEGLGKFSQGRKEIVEASLQRGRRGLGLKLKGFDGDLNVDWQEEAEPGAYERVEWFPECSCEVPPAAELRDWMTIGQRKMEIEDETEFCDGELLSNVLRCKSVFDELEGEEMRRARTRSNPFETIRGVFFLNRYQCPERELVGGVGCLGCRGLGEGSEGGVDGDGDITRPENISEFRRFVLENTERKGVHFLMADGGFSVAGQENLQEILSKQLLLCQILVGLSVVRTGGHFVCKTFDLFTPFSVGLIYLLYMCFERVSLFKPVTSRPANSERYVVCRGLKSMTDPVRDYLFTVNLKLNQLRNSELDVNCVVPLDTIRSDSDFFEYMVKSNQRHAVAQVKALAKIHAFSRDS
uniref:cap-specific mRNA (nucleoside-2'-O-)-methyltransferase 1-like n=1 Tax=Pristiophorus japonicus TaxID=55135 RepID=UPI00398EE298